MPELSSETIVVRQNAIRLVRRADTARWQAHYKVDALGLWVRKATGVTDVDEATEIAYDFWRDARAGIPPNQ